MSTLQSHLLINSNALQIESKGILSLDVKFLFVLHENYLWYHLFYFYISDDIEDMYDRTIFVQISYSLVFD